MFFIHSHSYIIMIFFSVCTHIAAAFHLSAREPILKPETIFAIQVHRYVYSALKVSQNPHFSYINVNTIRRHVKSTKVPFWHEHIHPICTLSKYPAPPRYTHRMCSFTKIDVVSVVYLKRKKTPFVVIISNIYLYRYYLHRFMN